MARLFCYSTFLFHIYWQTAVRLPIYVTPLVQYIKPKDKNRIVLNSSGRNTQPAQLLIGFHDRQYSWDCPSFLNIQGQLRLHGEGVRYFAPGLSLGIMENGVVDMGTQFTASHNLRIFVLNHLTIGDDNMWSYDCVILDNDGHQIYDLEEHLLNAPKEVKIGNHVWLGARNIVLKGTIIPDGCMIGAANVIRKEYDSEASLIAGGNIIRNGIKWYRPVK